MEKIKLIDLQKRKLQKCYLSLIFFTENIKIRKEGCFYNNKLYVLLGTDIYGNRQVVGTYFENTDYNRFGFINDKIEVQKKWKIKVHKFLYFYFIIYNKYYYNY